ncbi:MAG: hypothetical protein HY736_16445 [Verrucomicrobia bacterium]|nr:hypothetical protein [Verrucomicrobiota bacterium]
MELELDPELLAQLRALTKAERVKIGALHNRMRTAFGRPHEHRGLGVRSLGHGVFECRHGLAQRLVFQVEAGALYVHFMGTHDEVRRFLRKL